MRLDTAMISALLSKFQGYQPVHREVYCVFFDHTIRQSPKPFRDDITQLRRRLREIPRLPEEIGAFFVEGISIVILADFKTGLGMVADGAGFGSLGTHQQTAAAAALHFLALCLAVGQQGIRHPGDLFAPDLAVRI